jgi:hypothetical protein
MTGRRAIVGSVLLTAVFALPLGLRAQAQTASLGSVRIPTQVMANGQPLPAGSYTLRVSSDTVAAVVGQGPDAAKWVEFLQAGQVKGKELASVVQPADVKAVAKRTPPTEGRAMVQALRGADYIRVWVNHGGTQYLVHLAKK